MLKPSLSPGYWAALPIQFRFLLLPRLLTSSLWRNVEIEPFNMLYVVIIYLLHINSNEQRDDHDYLIFVLNWSPLMMMEFWDLAMCLYVQLKQIYSKNVLLLCFIFIERNIKRVEYCFNIFQMGFLMILNMSDFLLIECELTLCVLGFFGFVIRVVLGVVSPFLWSAPDEGLMCTASGMEALDNR